MSTPITGVVFEELREPETVEPMLALTRGIVRRSAQGDFELRRVERWLAIPKESQLFLGRDDQERLAAVFQSLSRTVVYAIALEEDPRHRGAPVCRVRATAAGLKEFNRECSGFNYVLCPEDGALTVVCSTDDYVVFAGPPELVAPAVGGDLRQAVNEFGSFALAAYQSRRGRALYLSIIDALANGYPQAQIGEMVAFPRKGWDLTLGVEGKPEAPAAPRARAVCLARRIRQPSRRDGKVSL